MRTWWRLEHPSDEDCDDSNRDQQPPEEAEGSHRLHLGRHEDEEEARRQKQRGVKVTALIASVSPHVRHPL